MRRVPVHVVAGFLGTGKTTAVRALLAKRDGLERAAVVVNDFGEAGIDAATLGGGERVVNIPGGCVCCTAPEGLVDTIGHLLDEVAPDRIYIEPSGLARAADVLDMLGRGAVATRLDRRPVIGFLDPGAPSDPERMDGLLDTADVWVLNRTDLASPVEVRALREQLDARWPQPVSRIETSHGVLPERVLEWPPDRVPALDHGHGHEHDHEDSTEGFVARSWSWPDDVVFRFDVLRALVEEPRVERFKGLFRTDLGWFAVERAGGRGHVATTGWRRDSRCDVIALDGHMLDEVGRRLSGAVGARAEDAQVGMTLEGATGAVVPLDRATLSRLAGQVPDVGAVVPGRAGVGVWLREVLELLPAPAGTRFVVVALDGLTTSPVDVARVGEAVLVHSLGDGRLPLDQGGPFRILGPSDSTRTACANVKGVARIRLLPGGR